MIGIFSELKSDPKLSEFFQKYFADNIYDLLQFQQNQMANSRVELESLRNQVADTKEAQINEQRSHKSQLSRINLKLNKSEKDLATVSDQNVSQSKEIESLKKQNQVITNSLTIERGRNEQTEAKLLSIVLRYTDKRILDQIKRDLNISESLTLTVNDLSRFSGELDFSNSTKSEVLPTHMPSSTKSETQETYQPQNSSVWNSEFLKANFVRPTPLQFEKFLKRKSSLLSLHSNKCSDNEVWRQLRHYAEFATFGDKNSYLSSYSASDKLKDEFSRQNVC
ncbi:hypothetical protein GEMRC1_013421 [Eukaryota sp. GEM-RC1]